MPIRTSFLIVLLAFGGTAAAQPRQEVGAAPTTLDLRLDPLADLYSWVRALAASEEPLPDIEGMEELVSAVREQSKGFVHPLLWAALDAEVEGCSGARELLERFQNAPEERQILGRTVPVRKVGVTIAGGLVALEKTFLEEHWPQRRAQLEKKKGELDETLIARFGACWKHVLESFGMEDPEAVIPVYLVTQSPPPGGMTVFGRGRKGAICFVGVEQNPGGQLVETVLHESLHALEIFAGREAGSAPVSLREKLQAEELSPRDPRMRNLPHLLLFVQAGETVRRVLDPEHRHYGEVSGAYERFGEDAKIVREEWTAFLDGQKTRAEALDAIVERAVGGRQR